jgi:ADP-heptose:LPS heptosyltransferase
VTQRTLHSELILHPGTLGDVLLSLPALREIRAEKGTSFVHLAAKGTVASFLKEVGLVEEASDLESAFYLSLYTDAPSGQLVEFIKSFHRVYFFTANIRSDLIKHLNVIASDLRVIHTIPKKGHVALYRARQINSSVNSLTPMRLRLPESLRGKGTETLMDIGCHCHEPLAVIHPGSGSVEKNAPLETFFSVSDYLIDTKGCFVLFITGYAEHESLIERIGQYVLRKQGRVRHLNSLSLMAVASILGLAYIYIGNDSGISHLASLCVDRVVVFFKKSNPELWSPIGVDVKIVTTDCGSWDMAWRDAL